jgi:RNA polymerase sigma-70 factor, ECF subfamily
VDVVERREHIATAFVTAIQALPPGQRAALLLKDVLGFSVPDIADALETSRAAVNSSLQRARATVGEATEARPSTDAETALRDQLMDAWHRADLDALTSLMTSDIVLTMPPDPVRFDGPDAIVESVAPEGRIDLMRLLPSTANQQPAMGLYLPDGEGNGVPSALIVLGTRGEQIERMTGFRVPPGHFARHGLPDSVQTD